MFEEKNIKHSSINKKKVRNLVFSPHNREFLTFLLFLFVSACFWLIQTLKNQFETSFEVPVCLVNVPKNAIITLDPPASIHVTIRDKGTTLLSILFTKKPTPIIIDFTQYSNSHDIVKIPVSNFSKRIASQFGKSTKIVTIKPDTIEYIYSIGKFKKVPVRFNGLLSTRMQYNCTDTICSPQFVTVYAPEHILRKITEAVTKYEHFTNLADTFRQAIEIQPINGAKFYPQYVLYTFPIDILTEKTIEIPVKGVGFPKNKLLKVFPSKIQVNFMVGLHRFKFVNASDFSIEIPYSDLINNKSTKYRLRLKIFPYGISHIRIIPENIDYLIEERNE